MALTETTAMSKQPEPPKVDDKPETAQNPSPDPSGRSSNLTDPAMEETLRATPSSLDEIYEKLFKLTPVVDAEVVMTKGVGNSLG